MKSDSKKKKARTYQRSQFIIPAFLFKTYEILEVFNIRKFLTESWEFWYNIVEWGGQRIRGEESQWVRRSDPAQVF